MAKGQHKNPTNRNQGHMATSEPSSPTTASPGYPNTLEKQELDLKSYLMMIEGFKKDLNNSLKEIQENISQQVKALKKETQKSLKEIQEKVFFVCFCFLETGFLCIALAVLELTL